MLEIENLVVSYGSIRALKGISLTVARGELIAVIGSNGAGKTTMLKTISSLLKASSGDVRFEGKSIQKLAAHEVTALGIAHSPEGRRIFAAQSVRDNLLLGAYLQFGKHKKDIEPDIERIYGMFPRLKERAAQQAGTLSGGEQQMLAIGRALMLRPKLLLLDEPSMGLAPVIIDGVFRVIQTLREAGETTILLVEQLAYRALEVADRGYVMEQGVIRLSGTGKELMTNADVRKAYLGATA